MRKKIFVLTMMFCSISISAQNYVKELESKYSSIKEVAINGGLYPQPSIRIITHWLSQSTQDWETIIMKRYALKNKRIEDGCITLSKDLSADNFSYVIGKCPSRTIILRWTDFRNNEKNLLEPLINELEPFYLRRNAGGYEYILKYEGTIYCFNILRKDNLTIIIAEKK